MRSNSSTHSTLCVICGLSNSNYACGLGHTPSKILLNLKSSPPGVSIRVAGITSFEEIDRDSATKQLEIQKQRSSFSVGNAGGVIVVTVLSIFTCQVKTSSSASALIIPRFMVNFKNTVVLKWPRDSKSAKKVWRSKVNVLNSDTEFPLKSPWKRFGNRDLPCRNFVGTTQHKGVSNRSGTRGTPVDATRLDLLICRIVFRFVAQKRFRHVYRSRCN